MGPGFCPLDPNNSILLLDKPFFHHDCGRSFELAEIRSLFFLQPDQAVAAPQMLLLPESGQPVPVPVPVLSGLVVVPESAAAVVERQMLLLPVDPAAGAAR